jgi:hypothetical protein
VLHTCEMTQSFPSLQGSLVTKKGLLHRLTAEFYALPCKLCTTSEGLSDAAQLALDATLDPIPSEELPELVKRYKVSEALSLLWCLNVADFCDSYVKRGQMESRRFFFSRQTLSFSARAVWTPQRAPPDDPCDVWWPSGARGGDGGGAGPIPLRHVRRVLPVQPGQVSFFSYFLHRRNHIPVRVPVLSRISGCDLWVLGDRS